MIRRTSPLRRPAASRAAASRPAAAPAHKRAKPAKQDPGTRQQLIEAAGQVFADKGFDRATGKEICRRAGANAAAINYHFGGVEELYAAVVWEAHSRLFTLEAISAAVAGKADAKAKLRAIIELIVRLLTGPGPSSWVVRVLGREIVAPSKALDKLREKEILPKTRIMRSVVGELMGLDDDHPAVARGCISVMAPCIMLLIFDRRTLKRAFPAIDLSHDGAEAVARHLVHFALAGLAAVAAEAKKNP